jgi:hypothetical protein
MDAQWRSARTQPSIQRIDSTRRLAGSFELAMAMAALLVLTGCGSKSDRLQVSGEVSLDGTPVMKGSINLTLLGGKKLASSGAKIRDGKFLIPQEKGLLPGTYNVVISAPDMAAVRDSARGPGAAFAPELIPPEYNTNSEKTIDVTADGENHFVFDIVNDKAR